MKGPLLLPWLLPAMCVGRWACTRAIPLPIMVCFMVGALVFGIHGLLVHTSVNRARNGAVALGLALGSFAGWVEVVGSTEWNKRLPVRWARAHFDVREAWPMRGHKHRAVAVADGWGRVILEGTHAMLPGQVMDAHVMCHCPAAQKLEFGFDEQRYLKGKGILYTCDVLWMGRASPSTSLAGKIHSRVQGLREAMMARYLRMPDGDARALIIALASGDRSFMSHSLRRSFSDLGLSHMTAVSGFHTGMVAGMLLLLLRWMGFSHRSTPWLLIPSLWLFVGLCGFPKSAVRALGMAAMATWGISKGRRPHIMTVLAFVGVSMWAVTPYVIGDMGVSLSFLATAGILTLNARIQRVRLSGEWSKRLCMGVAVPVVAVAFTAPVTWPAFGKIPTLFLPANLLATPCVTILAGMTAAWWVLPTVFAKPLEGLLLGAAEFLIHWVREMGDGQVLLLPLGTDTVRLAGASLAIGAFWALRRRGVMLYLLAGVLTACALLRVQHFAERVPQRFPLNQGVVSFDGDAWVVFPDDPRKDMKWETRSLLERVSHDPPEYARWCGTRLSFSRTELRYRQKDRNWSWVSSSGTHCGSPDLHMPPKPPCP